MRNSRLTTFVLLGALPLLTASAEVRLMVAYHSQTGNTAQMAEALAEGARAAGAEAEVKEIGNVTQADLEQSDAVAVGSPVHMGDVAVPVRKALVDWAYGFGFWRSRGLSGKACAVFATGGAPSNGKEFTMLSIALSLMQYGMVLVTPYGGLGASATTGVPESEKGVGAHELEEARELGGRLAEIAGRLKD
ncbi:MAG: flavodoxin domain-containing protein [Bryobacterales bacterium]|nr:flavodoxin domain-containing protein [Bryobacterales bacterium]